MSAFYPIPTVVDIKELPSGKRPCSDNPEFWGVWSRKAKRESDWNPIVDDWGSN